MTSTAVDLIARTAVWAAFIAVWASLTTPDGGSVFAIRSGVPAVIGFGLIAAGFSVYGASAWSLARAKPDVTGSPERLLTRGPYRYVRNPVYLSIAVMMAGVSVLHGAWGVSDIAKAAIVPLAVHLLVVLVEEPATRKRFGSAYDDYARQVPRWLPRRQSP